VPEVGQISFSAALAAQRGQEVSYITERAVFQLENGGLTLTEIAPGVRLEQDVLAHMGFRPHNQPRPSGIWTRASSGPGRWESARALLSCRHASAR